MDKVATAEFQSAFVAGLKELESEQVKTAQLVETCAPFAKLARAYDLVPAKEEVAVVKEAEANEDVKEADGLTSALDKLRDL